MGSSSSLAAACLTISFFSLANLTKDLTSSESKLCASKTSCGAFNRSRYVEVAGSLALTILIVSSTLAAKAAEKNISGMKPTY